MLKNNIAFICGSMEPGFDGVGDYTRNLAIEVRRLGGKAIAIAFNDRHIEAVSSTQQCLGNICIEVLRLPISMPSQAKLESTKGFLEQNDIKVVSLQYVPFSFQQKGITWKLSSELRKLGKQYIWHIMFHELWVGHADSCGSKDYWFGLLQKNAIKSLIRTLRPFLVTTQAPYYHYLLTKIGVDAKILPLFGNLPLLRDDSLRYLEQIAKRLFNNAEDVLVTWRNSQIGVIFGTIPSLPELRKFADLWQNSLQIHNQKGTLVLVGRQKSSSLQAIDLFQKDYPQISILNLGALPVEELSAVLLNCDFGLSPVPLVLAQKSGTIAAMKEHGLPVIITRMGKAKNTYKIQKDINLFFVDDFHSQDFSKMYRGKSQALIGKVAENFIALCAHPVSID